jgi:heme ABC exporter ATP-binding subunit CcmA
MPFIQLHQAIVVEGGFPLLAGVDLAVEQGHVVVLEGGNGAGKTSLLRLLGGLVGLSGGSGEVAGCVLARQPSRDLRRQVGWLGHEGSFYDELTVEENLTFAARAFGIDVTLLGEALERVGLVARRSTVTKNLSAGQRRRMGVAWLLMRKPSLWLLDEPHAALDLAARDLIDGIIGSAASSGATIVLSAHDHRESPHFRSRKILLAGGEVVR